MPSVTPTWWKGKVNLYTIETPPKQETDLEGIKAWCLESGVVFRKSSGKKGGFVAPASKLVNKKNPKTQMLPNLEKPPRPVAFNLRSVVPWGSTDYVLGVREG